jgi:hypothetical protein
MNRVKVIKDPNKWDIEGLEMFFSKTALPEGEIQLSPGVKITNAKVFVESHLTTVKSNLQVLTFKPYYDRLLKLKSLL